MPNSNDQKPQRPEGLQVLLEASSMLLATERPDAVLPGILELATSVLEADAYAVWRDCDGQGGWRAVASRGLSPSYRTQIKASPKAVPTSIQVVHDCRAEPSLTHFRDTYAAEGIRSLLVVPLLVPGQGDGTITFYWRQPHDISGLECDYATALANFSAAALHISELHQQNEREKRRLTFLAEASALLASSLDYETTLHQVAHLAVPNIADWCTIHILENGVANRIVVAHADPGMLTLAEEYSRRFPEQVREDRGLGAVLKTGESEIFEIITDEMIAAAAQGEDHLAILRKLGLSSSILVPLTSRGKVLGAIRFLAAGSGRHFNADDVQTAKELARRAGTAIENAQLHQAVLKQESELRLSHSAARIGSWSMDLEKRQVAWSNEFKELHGLPLDTVPTYEGGARLVHPEDRERIMREMQEVLDSEAEQITTEHRILTPQGRTLWIQSRGSIHRDEQGNAKSIIGVSMDVTEHRQAENALRRTEKLAAAGRLAATVAHEVNNPLEALTNLIYLAAQAEGLPEEVKGYLEAADSELGRLAHIVGQTLGFYRESSSPRPTDLGKIVIEVAELYRSRASDRGILLSCDIDHGNLALANGGEIKQVVANLISNALDATPTGGSVTASVARSGTCSEIVVKDTGTGIRAEEMERLFEPFFTTKPDVGTGLGLWVSKGIVEKHGGRIEVSSETDRGRSGTSFRVSLPAVKQA